MILVFGATGMVGQAVVREARCRGMRVEGAARAGADHTVDLAEPDCVTALLERLRPNLVINAAAMSGIEGCERAPTLAARVNARAVAPMSRYCRAGSLPFVQVSTDHFYSGDGTRKHGEEEPVLLLNQYARTKYAAEIFACEAPGALVLRTNVTGLRGR
ncbi:MAG: sugar nucleotide-binding protein, partial [Stellaceae bacterium]